MPKSITRALPAASRITFSGLTSRWTTPSSWAAARPGGDLPREPQRRPEGERLVRPVEQRPQGHPAHVLHRHEGHAVELAEVVGPQHVRVGDPASQPQLVLEPYPVLAAVEGVRAQHLEGDQLRAAPGPAPCTPCPCRRDPSTETISKRPPEDRADADAAPGAAGPVQAGRPGLGAGSAALAVAPGGPPCASMPWRSPRRGSSSSASAWTLWLDTRPVWARAARPALGEDLLQARARRRARRPPPPARRRAGGSRCAPPAGRPRRRPRALAPAHAAARRGAGGERHDRQRPDLAPTPARAASITAAATASARRRRGGARKLTSTRCPRTASRPPPFGRRGGGDPVEVPLERLHRRVRRRSFARPSVRGAAARPPAAPPSSAAGGAGRSLAAASVGLRQRQGEVAHVGLHVPLLAQAGEELVEGRRQPADLVATGAADPLVVVPPARRLRRRGELAHRPQAPPRQWVGESRPRGGSPRAPVKVRSHWSRR